MPAPDPMFRPDETAIRTAWEGVRGEAGPALAEQGFYVSGNFRFVLGCISVVGGNVWQTRCGNVVLEERFATARCSPKRSRHRLRR